MSTKELAVQALEILAGGASLELRWKVTCRAGEEFSGALQTGSLGASGGSCLDRHSGVLRVSSARSEASEAWGCIMLL